MDIEQILKDHLLWVNNAGGCRANLAGANLAGANLARANLARANLAGANLAGANLARANLAAANLRGANLTAANPTDANLAGANLYGADLRDANLTNVNLLMANLYQSIGVFDAGHDLRGFRFWAWFKGTQLIIRCGCHEFKGFENALDHYEDNYSSNGDPLECCGRIMVLKYAASRKV